MACVKIEKGIVEKTAFDRSIPDCKAYIEALIAKGHQAKTGHWAERDGRMLLFEAASLEQGRAIVAQDPLIQNGCVDYKLHEWRVVVEQLFFEMPHSAIISTPFFSI